MRPLNLQQTLKNEIQLVRRQLQQLDAEGLARESGFLRRCPRKIPMAQFLLALFALATESCLSLERIAATLSRLAQVAYTKQALRKRLTDKIEGFLARVATQLFGRLPEADAQLRGWLQPFRRVLLHDSTLQALPDHLAKFFPGSANGRARTYASLKVQFIGDLLSSQVLHLSLSGFTRNDQAAAPDILEVLEPGDLVIRDLGYFVIRAFQCIQEKEAFFVSRGRADVKFYDARTGELIDLVAELRQHSSLDRQVLMGSQKLLVRLVAQPTPAEVGNERRRKAKSNRDRRCHPNAASLFLMGWNLMITNVPKSVWPAKALVAIYRLRWRVEMIFKAWKSHLGLRDLQCHCARVLYLSVMTKLLFCVLVYRCCQALELLWGRADRHVSLQRLARIMGQWGCLIEAFLLQIPPEQWWEHTLTHHAFYEPRRDRKNYCEIIAVVTSK